MGSQKAFGCFLPILEGSRLDLRPLHEATPWCLSFSGPEGRGQGDCDGQCHGWKPSQGSSGSPPQGPISSWSLSRTGGERACFQPLCQLFLALWRLQLIKLI